MKKLIFILLLSSHLFSDECWNTSINNWIEFKWLEKTTDTGNAIDLKNFELEVYEIAYKKYGCRYTKDEI